MRGSVELLLFGALGLAGVIFWRLHVANAGAAAPSSAATGKPTGAGGPVLGGASVPPDRRWLLIPPGY